MSHLSERTCVGCRKKRQKKELLRIGRTKDEAIFVDEKQKMNGRGLYICKKIECWKKGKKKLVKALRVKIKEDAIFKIEKEITTILEESNG